MAGQLWPPRAATEVLLNTVEPTATSNAVIWVDTDEVLGEAVDGIPVGGDLGQVLTKDSSSDYDASWQAPASSSSSRTSSTVTTASLAASTSESGTTTLAKGYRILKIATNRPARVRLYTTTAKRDVDASRPIGTDPTGDHGLVMEAVTTASMLSIDATPAIDGYDGKATPDGVIGYRVTNTDVSAGTVAVNLLWIRSE